MWKEYLVTGDQPDARIVPGYQDHGRDSPKREKYIKDKKAIPYEIKGFEHFDNRVIYMNVIENKEMRDFNKGFVKAIKEVNYISFGSHEGENAIFHVTVSSKKVSFVFDEMWQWINQFNCNYNVLLNNISIYKWQDNTWKLHKRFELKE